MSDNTWFTDFMKKEVGAISLRVASAACYGATAAAAVVTVLIIGANIQDDQFSQLAIPTAGSFVCTYVLAMLATHFRNLARSAERAAAASGGTVELIGSSAGGVEPASTHATGIAANIAASTAVQLSGTSAGPSAGIDTPV